MSKTIIFERTLDRFGAQGEKTGWVNIIIPAELAQQLHATDRKSFRVKGTLDALPIAQVALIPMGEGDYVLPVNAAMRKAIRKPVGATVRLALSKDDRAFEMDADLVACIEDDPAAQAFFTSLAPSHQRYFSKWVSEAKTDATRTKRLAQVVEGLSRSMDFGSMVRYFRTRKDG
jgi:Domain of unknown function (DUF1905)/Bacteriocin-protection, YdeI or OmpD-Associated